MVGIQLSESEAPMRHPSRTLKQALGYTTGAKKKGQGWRCKFWNPREIASISSHRNG